MKILIVGREKDKCAELFNAHQKSFQLVKENPDMVVTFGGDGTLMQAEFKFPGVPKLYLKNSRVGKLAHELSNEAIVQALASGKYSLEERFKLAATGRGKTLVGINDIIIHNKDPRHAIRYTVTIDGVQMGQEIIGDGVVFATPLGSTGYYRSITDSSFESGIGLAFNNSTEQSDHVVLKEDRSITVRILRGPAVSYADNQDQSIELKDGDEVTIRKSDQVARLVRIGR